MKTLTHNLSFAVLLSSAVLMSSGCSKSDTESAEQDQKAADISDAKDPAAIKAAIQEKQSQNAAVGDPTVPIEQYEQLDGGNQLLAFLISMKAAPLDYEEFAEKINQKYRFESDVFKKKDMLEVLKPQIDEYVQQATTKRYVYTDHNPNLSDFDFESMSYTFKGLPSKGSEFYFYDNSDVNISYSNSDVFEKIKLSEEQARAIESLRAKYTKMNLRVYMFINDHKLGEPVVKAQIMRVVLQGPKGVTLASL